MDTSDPDNFVIYGNALPELEEEEASAKKMKPVPVEEQVATDDQGRRRFHGAFTGGFSAGFFNTAGSRDGWAPKHFKSSRQTRVESDYRPQQKPEDFMDDEDMGDFGIAPQKLQTSDKFRKDNQEMTNQNKRKHVPEGLGRDSGPIPGDPVLDQLIRPAKETIGVKLLKEMGWKPGQGVGPKLTRKHKKRVESSTKRLFGPSLPSAKHDESSSSEEDEDIMNNQYRDFLFAPDDIPNFVAKPKENLFGIGYQGLERGNVLGHVNLFGPSEVLNFDRNNASVDKGRGGKNNKKSQKLKISGQAFGVGAYEEDDEDIYQRDDMSRYDFTLDSNMDDQNEDGDSSNTNKATKRKSRWNTDVTENLIPALEGFALAKESSTLLQKRFDPPDIPKGFQPKGLKKTQPTRFETPADENLTTTNPTPRQRQFVISSETEKEQVKEIEAAESETQLRAFLKENFDDSQTESTAGSDQFKPFAKDPTKQKRYEQYLVCVKNGRKNALPILQKQFSMTEWEKDRERVEFERASMLFKPLNFSMSSRFVSAGSSQDADKVKAEEKELTEAEKAAKMKLYGNLTREVLQWHPARLLCLRFNVKPPFGDDSVVGSIPSGSTSKFDLFGRLNVIDQKPKKAIEQKKKEDGSSTASSNKTTENKIVLENDKPLEANEVVEKPPIDLFKSIFLASSSDDNDSDTEAEETKNKNSSNQQANKDMQKMSADEEEDSEIGPSIIDATGTNTKPWEIKPTNTLRNPNPARGIFANVDFDRLNKRPPIAAAKPSVSNTEPKFDASKSRPDTSTVVANRMLSRALNNPDIPTEKRMSAKDFFDDTNEDTFGPAKPKALNSKDYSKKSKSRGSTPEGVSNSSSDEVEWIESSDKKAKKSSKKSKKSSKKKHKHKSKSKKSKRKSSKHSKKKRKRSSTSSSSSGSSTD